ncbi:MAG TPA: rhomboid family intramembrane serine protease [Bacteroidia bacterium]|jgi:membrane associated rhomboid family serine protease|nr:rhomboid family intramembrane serine protease [Bacteroidia bacterium]
MGNNKQSLINSSLPALLFILLIWIIFYTDIHFHLGLNQYGLRPHTFIGLTGILTMPLLHADLGHIMSNSIPLLVLGIFLVHYYREIAAKVFFISYISSGFLVWIFGVAASVHIGASGLIYALAGFLFISGIIRKNPALFGVTLLITFLYGTIIWGVFPPEFQKAIHYNENSQNISWEGHLFGFLSGVVLAYLFRKKGLQEPKYSWDYNNDEDVDESDPYWLVNENEKPAEEKQNEELKNTSNNPYTVTYTFIPKDDEKKTGS